jgi:hypothetical protein
MVESFESDPVPPPVVYDRYDEPNHNEIVKVLVLLEYNEEACITDAIEAPTREAASRTAALEPVDHRRRQVLTVVGEVEQEPTDGVTNEVEAEEACELPGDATDFSDPEDTLTSPPSRPSPTRSSTATSSTTHRSPGRKSSFHARCTLHPTTTARLLHSLPSPNQAEVVESSEPESACPPVVYNNHVELGLYSFIPLIFSVEQVIEEVPVDMPTRCSMLVLHRGAYSVPNPPQASTFRFARSTPSTPAPVLSAATSLLLPSSMNRVPWPRHEVWYARRRCPGLAEDTLPASSGQPPTGGPSRRHSSNSPMQPHLAEPPRAVDHGLHHAVLRPHRRSGGGAAKQVQMTKAAIQHLYVTVAHSLGGLFALQLLARSSLQWRVTHVQCLTLSTLWGGSMQEMLENIFDCLCGMLIPLKNKERFVEGVEFMLNITKQKKLETRMEKWFQQREAKYLYMTPEQDNGSSMRIFTDSCGYTKFSITSVLVTEKEDEALNALPNRCLMNWFILLWSCFSSSLCRKIPWPPPISLESMHAREFYCRVQFPGFGRPFVFNAEILQRIGCTSEAKDSARVALQSPWWTLGCSYKEAADLASWLDGEARQLTSNSIDAQVMFDKMQQRRYVSDNVVPRIPHADGKNCEPHRCWEDNLDATGKAQQLMHIIGWTVDTEISLVRDTNVTNLD